MFHLIRLFYAYTIFLRSANEAHERRLLTNVEYILEGRFHTREQLNLLRQNCQRMPVMKTWHVAGAQSNTHRYHVYAYITSKTCRCLDFCLSMLVQTTVIKSFTCIIHCLITRFAGFVLGEDHVTLTEREEHERSSTIYPVRTEEDQEDST